MIYAVNKRTKEHRLCKDSHRNIAEWGGWEIVVADPDGWIPWGGECPLPDGTRCHLRDEYFPDEDGEVFNASNVVWGGPSGTTITGYRPILGADIKTESEVLVCLRCHQPEGGYHTFGCPLSSSSSDSSHVMPWHTSREPAS